MHLPIAMLYPGNEKIQDTSILALIVTNELTLQKYSLQAHLSVDDPQYEGQNEVKEDNETEGSPDG